MKLNDKFKTARSYLCKSQKEMAASVGTAYSSWQKYEQGTSVPGGDVFRALAGLGFNINWFFDDDVPMSKGDQAASTQGMAAPPRSADQGQDITPMPYDNIGLGESVELLAKIYNSGNPVLIRAIAANLHAFSEAIDNKTLAVNTVNMMKQMDKRMKIIEERLAKAEAAPPQKLANG